MKTKTIPAIVMLTAGFAFCVISIANDYGFSFLIRSLLWVLLGFYALGYAIKVVLDINMNKLDDDISAADLGFEDGEIIEDEDEDEDSEAELELEEENQE